MGALFHKWTWSKISKNKPRWANSILFTLVCSSVKPVEHMDGRACGDAEQPCCSLKCTYVNVHPTDSLLLLLFMPAQCLEFRPQNTVTELSHTERIPLLALGGAYILYREQQLVSVRSMSGFWLRLRVDQHSYKWLNSQLRKLASSTAMAGTFAQAEWECSTAREGERHCYLPCCSWVLQEDSSWMPGGRFKFPWRSRCFQLPPTCFALESCWVQAVFLRAQYSQM